MLARDPGRQQGIGDPTMCAPWLVAIAPRTLDP
jgi:hypothetical protein